MGFHDVRLNDSAEVDFGTRGAPDFSVSVIENDAGQEERVARWEAPKREYEASFGRKRRYNIYDLIQFFIGRQGPTHSFRFKDWADYATTSNGTVHLPAADGSIPVVTNTDETIGVGDGLLLVFQLAKSYTSGPVTRTRNLHKIVAGTTNVAVDGVAQTEGTHYSVNDTTGEITFVTAPANTLDVTAGCEFDVEVRFGSDTNLDVTIDSYATASTEITLVEVRDQTPNPEEAFHGGSYDHGNIGVDWAITLSQGRVHVFNPTTAGLTLTLPEESDLEPGGPLFYLVNDSAETVDLNRDDATLVLVLPANSLTGVWLSEASGVFNWIVSRA